jgi:hypothetical protein
MTLYGGATDDDKKTNPDAAIVQEALERWHACKEWQGTEDERTREDIKFANGDSRNQWQWDTGVIENRTGGNNDLPCLTINNTRTHNDIIINGMSKSGFGIKIRPTGGKASYKSAQVLQSVIRRIQDISRWPTQRRKIAEQQVDGGIGYLLIETRYVSNRSRNQDIFLRASRDPTGVYLDPWIRESDGSDAGFGFIFDPMPRKEFDRKYPQWKNKVGAAPLDSAFADWLNDKEVMLAKYFRKEQVADTYVWYKETPDGEEIEKLASEIREESGADLLKALLADIKDGRIEGGTRAVTDDKVKWYLIAGATIIDRGDWAGRYIPICRAVGREVVIDKTLDRKGHTRPLIDANRMLNYNASVSVEIVASQPKASWIAPARAFEGQEQVKTANINGYPVILYNDVDDEAPEGLQKIDPPQRLDPPRASEAHDKGMETAERHMMMISGQYENILGQSDQQSAASGVAIGERKEQGETATYHFVEHMNDMERFAGVQLLDLIPKIYDTKRALHVEDDAGKKHWISIDPDQEEAVRELEQLKEDEEAAKIAFNPAIGEYECISDPGPDYATQRQEAAVFASALAQSNKELMSVIGDLVYRFRDEPGADQISERLQKEIKATKPYLFDDKLEPQMLALQEQNKRLVALNAELMTKLADSNLKIRGRDEKRDIEAYNADTGRLKVQIDALTKMLLTPAQREQMEHEISTMTHQHVFDMIQASNAANIKEKEGADT